MAESSSLASRQLLFDLDGGMNKWGGRFSNLVTKETPERKSNISPREYFLVYTPVPAAEVLIDLKESARRRNVTAVSPRKRKTYNSHADPLKQSFNNYKTQSEDEKVVWTSDGSEGDEVDVPVMPKRRRGTAHNSSKRLESVDGFPQQPWIKQMRTFLRLPKALTWCRYEWFCSDIDRPFFGGENDFCQCLDEMFPNLKTRQLTPAQWRILRRMIGKPRRCSATFFAEERMILSERRKKVRELQHKVHQGMQLSTSDFNNFRDLPETVPAVLTVGTRVTAWLNTEKEKGFYSGTVEAVDLDGHKYWVTFDKHGIGKHSVLDSDIKSMFPTESISLSSLEATHTNRQHLSIPSNLPQTSTLVTSESHKLPVNSEVVDPLLASSPASRKINDPHHSHSLGGFPTNFLRQIVQMSKLLSLKQDRLRRLSVLNTDAEKMQARHIPLSSDFQKRYATIVIDLDDINRQLNLRSESIKKYTHELGYQDEPQPMSSIQECMEHATVITDLSNIRLRASGSEVKDQSILTLIAKLTGILLQVEMLSQEGRSHDLSGLQSSINEVASNIHSENYRVFQKHIETPLALIQSGMDPSESLHPFSVSVTKIPHRTKGSKS